MDYLSQTLDGQLIPLSIEYFAIYDPSLSNEETASDHSIVSFTTPDKKGRRDQNSKQRELSMIEGLYKFNKNFNDEEALEFIEMNDRVIIVDVVEDRYYFVLSVNFNKLKDHDDTGEFEFNKLNMAPFEFLKHRVKEIYDNFKLHNGKILDLFENLSLTEFQEFISNYFNLCFNDHFNLNIAEDGYIKALDNIRSSSLTIDYNLTSFIKYHQPELKFKELIIWNNNQEVVDEYGLVYKYTDILSQESLKSVLTFMEKNDYYSGLAKDNLLQSFISKNDRPRSGRSRLNNSSHGNNEEIFNPFKVVLNGIQDLDELTGVSKGLNYGVDTLQTGLNFGVDQITTGIGSLNTGLVSGFHLINGYIPFTHKGDDPEVTEPADEADEPTTAASETAGASTPLKPSQNETPAGETSPELPIVNDEEQDVDFLIGLQSNGNITYKNVYLKFNNDDNNDNEDELKLYKLVIFKILNFKFLLLYDFNENCINEMEYYGKISEVLFKINQNYLAHQQRKKSESNIPVPKSQSSSFYYIQSFPLEQRLYSNIPYIPFSRSNSDDEDEDDPTEDFDDLRNKYINIQIQKVLFKQLTNQPKKEEGDGVSTKESFFKYKNWGVWTYHYKSSLLILLKKSSNFRSGGKISGNVNIRLVDQDMIKMVESFWNHH